MARLQRFLAIPMAATAVGCLWLLYRQASLAGLIAGLAAVAGLSLLLLWTGRQQHKGASVGWAALAVSLVLTGIAATQVPRQAAHAARVPIGAGAWGEAAVHKHLGPG